MNEKTHTRRKRYAGAYPKKFGEKYKEHNPNQYRDTIEKVMSKGITPAGMHRPIMTEEILSFLNIQPNEVGIDLTIGFGGHSKEILEKLNHTGHLHGIDQDPIELPKTMKRLESYGFSTHDISLHQINFKDFDQVTEGGFDFILADLGVSSMQMDDPKRGFSFREEGPLDLRMNPNTGVPANIRLLQLSEIDIESMLLDNADEIYAKQIAHEITNEKQQGHFIETTQELYRAISNALKYLPKAIYHEEVKKAATRAFQALRIDVNNEFEVLYELLDKLPHHLNPGGRVAILSFHSGEDRLVKKAFKQYFNEGVFKEINGPMIPSKDEVYQNPRARSAKLRTAIKA